MTRRRAFGLVVGALLVALFAASASAQPAAALGRPLPDSTLPLGTVTVRVIRGTPSKPVTGVPVTLVGNSGAKHVARTSSVGRAIFHGLTPGQELVGEVTVDGKLLKTKPFKVAQQGGLRFMLSSKPLHMGGASGMPNPRKMSGIARPQSGDPAGFLTVRALQGRFSATSVNAPKGALIHLVGFGMDGSVVLRTHVVDATGHVRFGPLAKDGSVAYYALALFRRKGGVVDRLESQAVVLIPKVGMRLMLAGYAADSNKAPVDDVDSMGVQQGGAPPPGQVVVRLQGQVSGVKKVELVDLDDPKHPRSVAATSPLPLPGEVTGTAKAATVDNKLPAGTVLVEVTRSSDGASIANAQAALVPVGKGSALAAHVDAHGEAEFAKVPLGTKYRAVATVYGKPIRSAPFSIAAKTGMKVSINADWQITGQLEGRFSGVMPGPSRVYVAKIIADGKTHYSEPFQLPEHRGAAVGIVVYDGLLFGFHAGADLEDSDMWFQAQFSIANLSVAPRRFGDNPNGVMIPLPDGFVGASVNANDQMRVKVDKSAGFIWLGTVPPGQHDFKAQFAVPVHHGKFKLDMPLPYGSIKSELVFDKMPGVTLHLPPGVEKQERTLDNGRTYWVLSDITVRPGRRLVMGASGLPQHAAWRRHIEWGIGAVVVAMLGWALFALFAAPAPEQAGDRGEAGRTERLLDDLAALERRRQGGKIGEETYQRRRRGLMSDLERVYRAGKSDGRRDRAERGPEG